MNAAGLFVKCLNNEGVECIFGVPGEENADMLLALDDSPIRFVMTRHEQGAAFMADAWGRLTGKPGVCLSTLGPGAANLVTGVANANMDRSPIVLITGQASIDRQHKESHQAMDVVGMFRPITKWANAISHPNNIPEVVRKAFKLATTPKPGACHLELPEDIAGQEAMGEPLRVKTPLRPAPDDKAIEDAVRLLKDARKPIILAGNGVIRTQAADRLRKFVERSGIGVISTFMAKGCVSRHSEQCLFTIGLQARDLVACAVEDADVVVTLGYDLVEYPPRLWNRRNVSRVLHIDLLPAEVDDHYNVEVEVVGDIPDALDMLCDAFDAMDEKPAYDLRQQEAVRHGMLGEIAMHREDVTVGSIRPQKVLWDVREALGPEDIVLSDVGAHKMWIARHYQCDEPNTCLIPNGFCSMGFALPGAIAAKMIHPDRNVVAICGDGGFLMNVQEMETASRVGAGIVALVWEDGGYGLIGWKQQTEFGRHTDMSFKNPDWVRLADSFGWAGRRVERAGDLRDALDRALAEDQPTLLVVPIDYRENPALTKRLGNIVCPI